MKYDGEILALLDAQRLVDRKAAAWDLLRGLVERQPKDAAVTARSVLAIMDTAMAEVQKDSTC